MGVMVLNLADLLGGGDDDIAQYLSGPNRVVVNEEGEAIPLKKAEEKGITVDVVFVRKDGWTLGAPESLEMTAFSLWADEWTGFFRRPNREFQPIEKWTAGGQVQ